MSELLLELLYEGTPDIPGGIDGLVEDRKKIVFQLAVERNQVEERDRWCHELSGWETVKESGRNRSLRQAARRDSFTALLS